MYIPNFKSNPSITKLCWFKLYNRLSRKNKLVPKNFNLDSRSDCSCCMSSYQQVQSNHSNGCNSAATVCCVCLSKDIYCYWFQSSLCAIGVKYLTEECFMLFRSVTLLTGSVKHITFNWTLTGASQVAKVMCMWSRN